MTTQLLSFEETCYRSIMDGKRYNKEKQWLLQEKYQGRITAAAKKDFARLRAREPVDYLIGFIEFAGCKIDLSLRPLIPRPETEYWVLQAIEEVQSRVRPDLVGSDPTKLPNPWVLDMFAGSGCVGVAILKHILKARVDFAEKEKRFLEQIRMNLKKNNIDPKRSRVLQSDIFSAVKGRYDYIFANPPYVAESRKRSVQVSVLKYEPRNALFAGKDGLLHIRKFLKEAKKYLKAKGKIYLEFDSPQKREIDQLLKKFGYSAWQFRKDQYSTWRFVVASPWSG